MGETDGVWKRGNEEEEMMNVIFTVLLLRIYMLYKRKLELGGRCVSYVKKIYNFITRVRKCLS